MTNEQNNYAKRLENIKYSLIRGDKKAIATILGVTPVWVSYALGGKGISERVLQAAEELINSRQN